jgi:broad specificity phosphatase PhoE
MKVIVSWIRHAQSETNVIAHEQPWYKQWRRLAIRDAGLTKKGVSDAQIMQRGGRVPRAHLVVTSHLRRAIETALQLYPQQKVNVLCGLNELMLGLANRAEPHAVQRSKLSDPDRVTFHDDCNWFQGWNAQHFLRDLAQLTKEYVKRHDLSKSDEPIRVTVVGHSLWIQWHLQQGRPENLEVKETWLTL